MLKTNSKLLESIVTGVTQQILAGDYAPDERLPTESQWQEQWGVSRSGVREAMKVLASQGLVRVEQGRGTFVAHGDHVSLQHQIELALRRGAAQASTKDEGAWPLDVWDNLLDVRGVLEVSAAQRAALGAREEDLAKMQNAIDAMRARPDDLQTHGASDLEFHRALAAATQNPLWLALLESFNDLLHRYFDLSYHGRENALDTAAQHEAILLAIRARDAQSAVNAMQAHLQHAQEDLKRARELERIPPRAERKRGARKNGAQKS